MYSLVSGSGEFVCCIKNHLHRSNKFARQLIYLCVKNLRGVGVFALTPCMFMQVEIHLYVTQDGNKI